MILLLIAIILQKGKHFFNFILRNKNYSICETEKKNPEGFEDMWVPVFL